MLVVFQTYFGLKMTFRIIGPIYALKKHLLNFIDKNKSPRTLFLRENDEFQDLVNTYNYAFLKIKSQNKRDLEALKKIQTGNPESQKLMDELIQTKEDFLENPLNESDVSPLPSRDSHLAS